MDNSETNHVTDAPGTVLETEDPNALMSENKEPTDSKESGIIEARLVELQEKLDALQAHVASGQMLQQQVVGGGTDPMPSGAMRVMAALPLHTWYHGIFKDDSSYERIKDDLEGHKSLDDDALRRKKKSIQTMMEAELDFLKREDNVYAQMMERQAQFQRENATLAQKVLTLETALQKAAAELPPKDQDEAEKKDTTDTGPNAGQAASDCDPCPSVNRLEWSVFISPQTERFAIDVLDGEPILTFASFYRPWTARRNTAQHPEPTSAGAAKRKQLPPGQGALPERIRINSRLIIKILQKIDPEAFSGAEEPLVMIRPFKALVYYEDQIRQIHQELNKKVHSSPPGTLAASSANTDAAHKAGDDREIRRDKDASETKAEGRNADSTPAEEALKDPLTSSPSALQQLSTLIDFLDTDIKPKAEYMSKSKPQKITFHDVWYLFRPGDEVVSQGGKQAYRILNITSSPHKVIPPWRNFETMSAKSDETPVQLFCVHIDFDGTTIGPVLTKFEIPRFDGEKSVISLPVLPLRYYHSVSATAEDVRAHLIARGRMFLDVLNQKHMHYNGLTLENRDEVDGQVVVDFEKAFEMETRRPRPLKSEQDSDEDHGNRKKKKSSEEESWQPKIVNLIGWEYPEVKDVRCDAGCCNNDNIHKDAYAEAKRNSDYQSSLIPVELSREPSVAIFPRRFNLATPEEELSEEDYVIMSYRVFGFVLRNRKWAKLDLTYLSYIGDKRRSTEAGDPDKRETAFDQLVLDPNHKRVLQSLVAQHYRDKQSPSSANEQVDIVRGKGKGLIILLHGAPGVGKTTTAEGVAELFEKPLFQITCGDLGTTAEDVENALETNFALANRWGCILLLDEADVFLSKRTPYDFIRNGLVSVFLRVLEYYAGILFLTTNRIGDFDEAFTSRIHISLHYPQLTLDATEEIFQLNIRLMQQRFAKKKRPLQIDQTAILNYAKKYWTEHETMRWNGRQIRNACQTALALAEFDAGGGSHEEVVHKNAEVRLGVEHLSVVCRAYLEFMKYLRKLYKTDQDRLAQKRGYRARELHTSDKYHSDDEAGGKPSKGDESKEPELPPFTGDTTNHHTLPEVSPQAAVTAGYPPAYSQMFAPPQAGGMNLTHYGAMPPPTQQQQLQYQQQQAAQAQAQAQMWGAMNPAWQQMMLQNQMPPPPGPGPAAPGKE